MVLILSDQAELLVCQTGAGSHPFAYSNIASCSEVDQFPSNFTAYSECSSALISGQVFEFQLHSPSGNSREDSTLPVPSLLKLGNDGR